MRALPNPDVLCDNSPPSLAIKRRNPVDVGDVCWKLIAQCYDLVLNEKGIECLGEARAQIMIQQQLQATSCCWKATASRTASRGTPYNLATFSGNPSTFTASDIISAGTLPSVVMGRPNARAGS